MSTVGFFAPALFNQYQTSSHFVSWNLFTIEREVMSETQLLEIGFKSCGTGVFFLAFPFALGFALPFALGFALTFALPFAAFLSAFAFYAIVVNMTGDDIILGMTFRFKL